MHKKTWKITKKIQKQTEKKRNEFSNKIDSLLKKELKKTVDIIVFKHLSYLENTLGYNKDDLLNDIRVAVWKGLLTYDSSKKVLLTTYLVNIINNMVSTLRTRANSNKNTFLRFYADVHDSDVAESDLVTEETGELIFERRQECLNDLKALSDEDEKIYRALAIGDSISKIMDDNGLKRHEAIGKIKNIISRIEERRNNTSKGVFKRRTNAS